MNSLLFGCIAFPNGISLIDRTAFLQSVVTLLATLFSSLTALYRFGLMSTDSCIDFNVSGFGGANEHPTACVIVVDPLDGTFDDFSSADDPPFVLGTNSHRPNANFSTHTFSIDSTNDCTSGNTMKNSASVHNGFDTSLTPLLNAFSAISVMPLSKCFSTVCSRHFCALAIIAFAFGRYTCSAYFNLIACTSFKNSATKGIRSYKLFDVKLGSGNDVSASAKPLPSYSPRCIIFSAFPNAILPGITMPFASVIMFS